MQNNQFYIIRAAEAGVFFGHIKERNGNEVTLTDCRQEKCNRNRHHRHY